MPRAWSASAAARARGSATSRPCAGCCAPSGATPSASSCSAPSTATTACSTAAWPRSPTASASPAWPRATSMRTRVARARLQDAFVAIREHTTLDASEPLRRGNHSHVLATPEAMAARFADHPDAVAETERLADTLRFDLTSDLGYRYPGAEDDGADRKLAEVCHGCFEARYPMSSALRAQAAARLEEELSLIASLGLSGFFLLHREMLELAREVAVEVRGRSTARALLPPGRGRGSSVSSIVCYLTGPLARRPDRQQAAARALPQRGDLDAARHRPRLPARRARGPHPARARSLRARPRRAGGRLPDLPRARRHPRAGQGAGPAAGGDRARGARLGGLARGGRRSRHRHRAGGGPRGRGPLAAGWARCPRRPTACPATSPSTPAA